MTPKTIESPRRAGRSRGIALDHLAVRRLLPQRSPLLLVDRVEGYFPAERRLVAIKNVSQNDPFLQGHFPEYPIFPGVLIVEALAQAATLLMHLDDGCGEGTTQDAVAALAAGFRPPLCLLAESRVKHVAPSYPGDQIRLEAGIAGSEEGIVTFRVKALTPAGEVASQGRVSIARSPETLSA